MRVLKSFAIVLILLFVAVSAASAAIIEDFDDGHINISYSITHTANANTDLSIVKDGDTYVLKFYARFWDALEDANLIFDIPNASSFACSYKYVPSPGEDPYIKIILDNGATYTVGSPLDTNKYYLYVVLIGDTLQIYRNGVLISEVTNTGGYAIDKVVFNIHKSGYDEFGSGTFYIDNIAISDYIEPIDYDQVLYKTPTTSTYLNLELNVRPWANDVKLNIIDYDAGILVDTVDLGNQTHGVATINITNYDLGLYLIELVVDGQTLGTTWFYYADGLANHTLSLDKEEYFSNEEITATYQIDPYYEAYEYAIKIYDSDENLVATYPITNLPSGTITFPAPEKGGTYYAILTRSDGLELAADVFVVLEQVILKGYVKDQDGNPIANATVKINQLTNIYTVTTDSNGYYESPALYIGSAVAVDIGKAGYQNYTTKFTPQSGGIYWLNATLISNESAYGIWGIVKKLPVGTPLAGVTIRIENATWNQTALTNEQGFYRFYVSPGTYTITVSKGGFTSDSATVTLTTSDTLQITKENTTLLQIDNTTSASHIIQIGQARTDVPAQFETTINNGLTTPALVNISVNGVLVDQVIIPNGATQTVNYQAYVNPNSANTITFTTNASTGVINITQTTVTYEQFSLRVDFGLYATYQLVVHAKTDFGMYLNEFQCTIQDLTSQESWNFNTTTGSVVTILKEGWYSITVITDKYYGGATVYLDQNRTIDVVVVERPTAPTKQVVTYPPLHAITLKIVKGLKPYTNVTVTITDQYGNKTELVTDSFGRVVFWGNKTIKYTINVNNSEKVVELYPSESEYIIVVPSGFNFTEGGGAFNVTNGTWQWGLTGIAANVSKQMSPTARGIVTAIVVWLAMFGVARFMQNASIIGLITLIIMSLLGFTDWITTLLAGMFIVSMYVLKRWL